MAVQADKCTIRGPLWCPLLAIWLLLRCCYAGDASFFNMHCGPCQGHAARYGPPNPRPPPATAAQGQRLTNPPPFCAELFNPRNLPWGFHSVRLRRLGAGFPAVLDINLSQDAVLQWLGFLQEGLFLGTLTRCDVRVHGGGAGWGVGGEQWPDGCEGAE